MKTVEVDQEMDQGVREQLEQRCKDGEANRKGTQIHLTGVWPFDDMQHRKHLCGVDKEDKVAVEAQAGRARDTKLKQRVR